MSDIRKEFERFIKQDPFDIVSRHVFADYLDEETDEAELATFHREMTLEKVKIAKAWLEDFVRRMNAEDGSGAYDSPTGLDELVEAGRNHVERGTYVCLVGVGFWAEEQMDNPAFLDSFWEAWSNYTGTYFKPEGEHAIKDGKLFLCFG